LSRELRLGLIGAGRWGRTLFRALGGVVGARWICVANRTGQRREWIPDDCTVVADWRTVVEASDVDGVVVATSPRLHAEISIAALSTGKPVFVEKPMALELADAISMIDLARRQRLALEVDHIDWFNPAWITLKECLGSIGAPRSVEAIFGSNTVLSADVAPRWQWAPHPIGLCLDLFGRPVDVRARWLERVGDFLERVEVELSFSDGLRARIETGNAFATRCRWLAVHGNCDSLIYDDNAAHKVVRVRDSRVTPVLVPSVKAPLTLALEHFVGSIQRGAPSYAHAERAAEVVETLAAVDVALTQSG